MVLGEEGEFLGVDGSVGLCGGGDVRVVVEYLVVGEELVFLEALADDSVVVLE